MKTISTLVMIASLLLCVNDASCQRFWTGVGAGGLDDRLSLATNWTGSGSLLSTDSCVINLTAAAGPVDIKLPTSSSLNIGALTIILPTQSAASTVNINIYNTLTISGTLTIANTSASAFNDSISFNIGNASGATPGAVTAGAFVCIADGIGNSGTSKPAINLSVNKNSSLTCTGNWTSTAGYNSYTSTWIMNYGAITINGFTNASNYGKRPVRYLVGDTTTTVTFNGNTKFGVAGPDKPAAQDSSKRFTGVNQIYLGGMAAGSKGNFIFKGSYDTLGYNFGTENFKKGTILFENATATTQTVTSYAGTNVPDRIPGTFQVGYLNSPIVNYELGAGDNDALTISYALIVNTNSTLQLRGVVTPSNANNTDPDGLVQVKAGAKLILLTKAGKSASVPGNYKYYNFDRSSTLVFNGNYQTLYSGIEYGNVTISGTADSAKTAGGSLTIKGNLTIDPGRIFNARFDTATSESAITVQGNWTNNGTFNPYYGTVILDSANDKVISGTSVTTFHKLVMNKDGKSMRMDKDVIVNDSLKLDSGQLKVNDKTLTLNGAVTHLKGSLTGSDKSKLILDSADKKNLYFTPGSHTFQDVTINALATDVNLDDSLYINSGTNYGTLTVNGNLKTNGWLTLKSSALASARVGPSYGTIQDTVTVERYIPARRAWRFLAVPFKASNQTINAAWQEGATPNPNSTPVYNPNPGYGTEITWGHGMQSLGFDENRTSNPSLYSWDPVLNNFVPVPQTYIPITSYSGYYMFIRGDRSINLSLGTSAVPNNTVLRAKGILNETGSNNNDVVNDFNNVSYAAGLNLLVSNPYASPIKLLDVINRSTNIVHDKFKVWCPSDNYAPYPYNIGNFVDYSAGYFAPVGSSYNGDVFAQSGQAFMVETTGGAPVVNFKQADKDLFQMQVFGLMAAPQSPDKHVGIYTNLYGVLGGVTVLMDGVTAGFNNEFSADVDKMDAKKLWNPAENIALMRNGQPLAIELRPMPKATDTLFYKLSLNPVPYTLQLFSQNMPKNVPGKAFLVDKYLNNETEVNLHDTTLYNFTANTDTNSYRNRFMLVFNRIRQPRDNVETNITADAGTVTVFPNPVTGETVKLQFTNMPKGDYDVNVYNAKGEQLLTRALLQSGGNAVYSIPTNTSWKAGVYTVSIINRSTKKAVSVQLIVNR